MMRRRSSSRCSRKPIAGRFSLSSPCEGSSPATSGIGSLSDGIGRGCQLRRRVLSGRHVDQRPAGDRGPGRLCRWKNLRLGLPLQIGDLRLDLGPEFIRSPLQLVESLPHLPSNLRKLLRSKHQKRQEEQEGHLRKTEHSVIILPEPIPGNATAGPCPASARAPYSRNVS